uniref:Uncharacterized protein n=1 Tax=Ananas comosus var. bracteatus TaxID=296719 RepID=A0A6V7Q2F8_ANACO|nr:unnamed protein product [Ananas comosus var. bracteatus]
MVSMSVEMALMDYVAVYSLSSITAGVGTMSGYEGVEDRVDLRAGTATVGAYYKQHLVVELEVALAAWKKVHHLLIVSMSMKMAPMDNAIIHGPREEGHPLLMVSMSVEMASMDHVTVYRPRSMVQHDLMAVKVQCLD